MQATDKELFDVICAGAPREDGSGSGHSSFVADRAEVALRTCAKIGCTSRVEVLSYLGMHFRIVLPHILEHESDEQVCCVLITALHPVLMYHVVLVLAQWQPIGPICFASTIILVAESRVVPVGAISGAAQLSQQSGAADVIWTSWMSLHS